MLVDHVIIPVVFPSPSQLNSVTLQATTQQTIVTNIVQQQTATTTTLNGTIRLINAETSVIQGEAEQLVQFYLANTTRDATIITQTAAANGAQPLCGGNFVRMYVPGYVFAVSALQINSDSTALSALKTSLAPVGFGNAQVCACFGVHPSAMEIRRLFPHRSCNTCGCET